MYSPKVGNYQFPPKNLSLPWSYEVKEESTVSISSELIYKSNMQIVKNDILKRNLDWIHLNFGAEGTGKTSLAIQDALEIDPKFDKQNMGELPQVPFSVKQFKQFLEKWRTDSFYEGRRGAALIFDEGNLVANARRALSKESQEFVSLLTQIRAEFGFYIIFNFQSYRLAETYLKNDRCRSASKCYFTFDKRAREHISGQADYYNAPMVRQFKVNSTTRQIEFPKKRLFQRKFKAAFPFALWKAINEKKYLHLLDVEEQTKNRSTTERKKARLETQIQIAKLDNNTEKVKLLSQELKQILLKEQ